MSAFHAGAFGKDAEKEEERRKRDRERQVNWRNI
jgi:hypothetical protein